MVTGTAAAPTEPVLSVVVVHHRGREILGRCLSSLRRQTLEDLELVLVDNGSTDGSVESALAERVRDRDGLRTIPAPPGDSDSHLHLVKLASNIGFAGGANAGIRACRSSLVALLNDDAEANPEWAAALVEAAQRNPWAGFFASRMLQASGSRKGEQPGLSTFDFRLSTPDRGLIDSAGDLMTHFGEGANRGRGQPDGPAFDDDCEVFGACAGAAMYRLSMLEDVGLFDERFFHSCEDVDLSLRARLRGWRCLYVAAARVSHLGAATRDAGSAESVYYQARNVEMALWANLPALVLARVLPWHSARVAWGLAAKARSGRLMPYMRGKLSALAEMPRLLSERRRRLSAARECGELLGAMDDSWHLQRLAGVLSQWKKAFV